MESVHRAGFFFSSEARTIYPLSSLYANLRLLFFFSLFSTSTSQLLCWAQLLGTSLFCAILLLPTKGNLILFWPPECSFIYGFTKGQTGPSQLGKKKRSSYHLLEEPKLNYVCIMVTREESGCLCIHRRSSSCLLYTSPSPRDLSTSRMPSSA